MKQKLNILIVEDEAAIREGLIDVLVFHGYDVEATGDGAYLAQADIHDGFDRVVAIFDDGRGFAWHQLNEKYAE